MTGDPKTQPHVLRPKGEPTVYAARFQHLVWAQRVAPTASYSTRPRNAAKSMRGFEEQYVDIIDYIVRITHRIWEEKHIGYIYDTYKH